MSPIERAAIVRRRGATLAAVERIARCPSVGLALGAEVARDGQELGRQLMAEEMEPAARTDGRQVREMRFVRVRLDAGSVEDLGQT